MDKKISQLNDKHLLFVREQELLQRKRELTKKINEAQKILLELEVEEYVVNENLHKIKMRTIVITE